MLEKNIFVKNKYLKNMKQGLTVLGLTPKVRLEAIVANRGERGACGALVDEAHFHEQLMGL
jgi:hypothetical protein